MFLQDYYQLYTHKCRKPKPQKVVNNVCQYFVLFISSLTSNIIFPTLFKDISPLSSFLHSQDLFTINVCYLNYYFSSSVGIVSAMFSYLVSSIMLLYNLTDRYEIPIIIIFAALPLVTSDADPDPTVAGGGVPGVQLPPPHQDHDGRHPLGLDPRHHHHCLRTPRGLHLSPHQKLHIENCPE